VPLLGLFRWRDSKLTEHQTRVELLEQIGQEPGIILSELKQNFGLHNGTAAYHLGLLESGGLIRSEPSVMDGRARGFVVTEWQGDFPLRFTPSQQRFFDYLKVNPGASLGMAAQALDLARQTVEHTALKLEEQGLLRRENTGVEGWQWYITEK